MDYAEYPKIQTLYPRGSDFKVATEQTRFPEYDMIKPKYWLYTEKVDGTNIRVILTPEGEVLIRGRTDRAQFSAMVMERLQSFFPQTHVKRVFGPTERSHGVILYGEAYGPKIQKGGIYREDVGFRLFDVAVGRWWLRWDDVVDVASKLQSYHDGEYPIAAVPTLPRPRRLPQSQSDVMNLFTDPLGSLVAFSDSGRKYVAPEGIVARTDPYLFDRHGLPVRWKLKLKDFADDRS